MVGAPVAGWLAAAAFALPRTSIWWKSMLSSDQAEFDESFQWRPLWIVQPAAPPVSSAVDVVVCTTLAPELAPARTRTT